MNTRKHNLLFVDDDPVDRMAFERFARTGQLDCDFMVATSSREATEVLSREDSKVDIIISDFHLLDGNALDVIKVAGDIPVIITTGTGDESTAVQAIKAGAYDYLIKDADRHYLTVLPITVSNALGHAKAQVALRESEKRFRIMADNAPVLIWISDESRGCVYFNTAWYRFTGRSPEQELGEGWLDGVHPDDRLRCITTYGEAFERRESFSMEYRLRRSDGEFSWIVDKGAPLCRESGEFYGYIGSCLDIDGIKKSEAELRMSEERLKLALKGANLGLWDWDIRSGAVVFNERWASMIGYQLDEIRPHVSMWSELVHPDDMPKVMERLSRHLEGKTEFYEIEHRLRTKDGRWKWILDQGKVIERDEQGNPLRAVGTHLDVTERLLHEEEMAEARALAEAANKAKGEFLANMSHEIRTPLTSIIGYSDALLAGELTPEETSQAIKNIASNGGHLLGLINDILDLSKIDSGALEVERIECSLVSMFRDLDSLMRQRASEKGIELKLQFIGQIPGVVFTDPLRLKQILINLLGNALKFTRKGFVSLSLSFDRENRRLQFQVVDSGIGMSVEQTQKLFRPFSQADASTTREFGGTGLGLAICARLANLLGGNISVSSVPSVGSTFAVSLQAEMAENVEFVTDWRDGGDVALSGPSDIAPQDIRGKVLIADDSKDNRNLLAVLLRKTGVEAVFVEDGRQACEAVAGGAFDLILMDMQMPVLDGLEATKKLRADGCPVPIVALTANVMKQDIERCLGAGCNGHLPKPFKLVELYETLGRYLQECASAVVDQGNAERASRTERSERTEEPLVYELPSEFSGHEGLVEQFLVGLMKSVSEIAGNQGEGGSRDILEFAHKVRGTAALYGFRQLAGLGEELERVATGQDSAAIASVLAEMKGLTKRAQLGLPAAIARLKGS